MNKLLQLKDSCHWNLEGITFAIQERVGKPEDFIGRVEEMEFFYNWIGMIPRGVSHSTAFLGRRKVGKSLMLERLYNIIYSEHKGIIPFYYEFTEGERSARKFYHDFATRFYMQVIGYYTRDVTWIREAVNKEIEVKLESVRQKIEPLSFPNKDRLVYRIKNTMANLAIDQEPYEYVIAAVAAPDGFAKMVGMEERVVQMIDEFQYLNMFIDAGVEDKPCRAYMSTAESRLAPLLITGSLMGVVAEELMRLLPHRFGKDIVPRMATQEAIAMTLNYGRIYGHGMTQEIAEYIVYVTNNVPGRIVELLNPRIKKPMIHSIDDVDRALEFEVSQGEIKADWDEYLSLAMNAVNHVNMRKITYFLCKHEGELYYPRDLQRELALELDLQTLRTELALLHKYDIIELYGGRYGGVFDRTLKKVLMKNFADLFDLPVEEFDAYFKNDNMLDYLKERVAQLELDLAEAEQVRHTLRILRGEHNELKGHYYEREVLLRLIKAIMDGDGGIVEGISITDFRYTLNYHLETGQELDVVMEGEQVVIVVECKHYAPEHLHKLTTTMVDDFIAKAAHLHERFPDKELRPGFFSRHGFLKPLQDYLKEKGIYTTI